MNILVSACLLGINCRYDGSGEYLPALDKLKEKHCLIPFCPECYGGLPTPRTPAEISGGRVATKDGEDVTEQYNKGASEALRLAKTLDCKAAILKSRSPSCGFGAIYDGSFSKRLVKGNGIAAELLYKSGINVIADEDEDKISAL